MSGRTAKDRRPMTAILVGALVGLAPILAGIGALGGVANRNKAVTSEAAFSGEEILSVRRVNDSLANDVAVSRLRSDLQSFVDSVPKKSCLSVLVSGRTAVASNADEPLIPASNMKIVTALVALDVLGPNHRFETKIVGEVVDGVATGNLYVVGGGDPVLSLPNYPNTEQYPTLFFTDVMQLLTQLVDSGLTRIEGSLVGDGSLFDDQRYPSGWSSDIKKTYGGPIGALLLDDGSVFGLATKPDDPAYAASLELSARLRNLGVTVIGSAVAGKAIDELPVIASVQSAPLSDIVTEMLTNSDNNTAEMLVKAIGLAKKGIASTAAGIEVAIAQLASWGMSTDGVVIADGSGLDRSNRLSCDLITDLLNSDSGQGLVTRMAIGGTTGTLIEAFTEPPALGVVRAKTGSLTGVKALSGFASDKPNVPIFSLIYNGTGVNEAAYFRPRWTQLITGLFSYQLVDKELLDLKTRG